MRERAAVHKVRMREILIAKKRETKDRDKCTIFLQITVT